MHITEKSKNELNILYPFDAERYTTCTLFILIVCYLHAANIIMQINSNALCWFDSDHCASFKYTSRWILDVLNEIRQDELCHDFTEMVDASIEQWHFETRVCCGFKLIRNHFAIIKSQDVVSFLIFSCIGGNKRDHTVESMKRTMRKWNCDIIMNILNNFLVCINICQSYMFSYISRDN